MWFPISSNQIFKMVTFCQIVIYLGPIEWGDCYWMDGPSLTFMIFMTHRNIILIVQRPSDWISILLINLEIFCNLLGSKPLSRTRTGLEQTASLVLMADDDRESVIFQRRTIKKIADRHRFYLQPPLVSADQQLNKMKRMLFDCTIYKVQIHNR